jgi:hypothetical protein
MGYLRALAVRLGFMTLLGTLACDDGGDAPSAPGEGDEDADISSDEDAGEGGDDEDGGETDAAAADGGADAEATDGASEDGSMSTADAGDVSECLGDVLEFNAARSPGRPLTAGILANTVHLVYVVPAGGGSSGNNSAQGLRYVSFATTGAAGAGEDVVNTGPAAVSRTRDPALVVSSSQLDLFYTSNAEGSFELFHKVLGSDDAPVRETTNTERNEYALSAGSFGDSAVVVYADEPASFDTAGALSFKLPGRPATELLGEAAGYHAAQTAFAELGESAPRLGMAAFLSDLPTKPGLFAIPVGANGMPDGALVTLSTSVGGASAIDVTRGKDGKGALVYTETPAGTPHQLRFRGVSADGVVGTTVRTLTSGNQDLRDISVAAYSHGYVIAYRRVGGVPGYPASINLMFVDAEGNRAGTRLVRSAALSGGGLKVLVANDGRLVVLWADIESVMNEATKQTEIALKVRAARLNCAP